ncbi:hypothetical protein AL035_06000 [Salipiger aestuarii]|jgi:hypothetical protein|uniref:Uncharacterized protein DUF4391 n=1 Tax=Salipiger aestuarii TaxID=568098 RepID=A0A327YM40_9RHOB|nr:MULTISPECIES: DUF4391 domain-containing protein [Roseobacteraceae]KAB2542662.1 hypothetical protein AL035_06000 [Salipiger aestuarii]MCZ4256165.1 DUF4391 domain-containing protein [Sulfitobacter sp. G21635-S1]RAK19309.1 uncharacterized protein DUF4391 [Salipiger aestuarii]
MTLYQYPPQTALKRVIPKTRIYDGAAASTALRERFVREVDQITWAHKLAPETLNLPATPAVPEIQVFRVTLKGDTLHDDILRAMDRAIPFPLMFELVAGDRIQPAAAYKRPSEAERGKWVLSDPLRGEWAAHDAPRAPLPVAVNMGVLYDRMLSALMPVAPVPGEDVESRLARLTAIRAKEREIAQLQSRLRRESQFNIKVTLHGQLAEAQAAFDHMKDPGKTGGGNHE